MTKNNTITNTIINQCLDLLSLENKILKEKIIDPLVVYFKQKLLWVYLAITILLSIIILVCVVIIFKLRRIDMLVSTISLKLQGI